MHTVIYIYIQLATIVTIVGFWHACGGFRSPLTASLLLSSERQFLKAPLVISDSLSDLVHKYRSTSQLQQIPTHVIHHYDNEIVCLLCFKISECVTSHLTQIILRDISNVHGSV